MSEPVLYVTTEATAMVPARKIARWWGNLDSGQQADVLDLMFQELEGACEDAAKADIQRSYLAVSLKAGPRPHALEGLRSLAEFLS